MCAKHAWRKPKICFIAQWLKHNVHVIGQCGRGCRPLVMGAGSVLNVCLALCGVPVHEELRCLTTMYLSVKATGSKIKAMVQDEVYCSPWPFRLWCSRVI